MSAGLGNESKGTLSTKGTPGGLAKIPKGSSWTKSTKKSKVGKGYIKVLVRHMVPKGPVQGWQRIPKGECWQRVTNDVRLEKGT